MVIGVVSIVSAGVGVGLLLLVINGIYLFNKFKDYLADITTKSFFQIIGRIYDILPRENKAILLIQFLILVISTIIFAARASDKKKQPVLTKACLNKEYGMCDSRTDLDMLYRVLLSKREVRIKDIERLFKIDHDVAIEWCKTLENANLAIIDYPNFQGPILILPENPENKESVDTTKLKKGQAIREVTDTITGKKRIEIVEAKPQVKTDVTKKPITPKKPVNVKPSAIEKKPVIIKKSEKKNVSKNSANKPKRKKVKKSVTKPKITKKKVDKNKPKRK